MSDDSRRVSETLGTGQPVDAPFGGTVKDIHASCRDEIERLRKALALAVGELSTYGNMQYLSPEQVFISTPAVLGRGGCAMNDDLVTRLRVQPSCWCDGNPTRWQVQGERYEAAAVIEGLRADRNRWKEIAIHLTQPCDDTDCHYCNLARGATQDLIRQTIKEAARHD